MNIESLSVADGVFYQIWSNIQLTNITSFGDFNLLAHCKVQICINQG